MEALIRAAQAPDYPAEIKLVLSNRPNAKGLETARAAGIEAVCVDHKAFASRDTFDGAVHAELASRDIELVALAGFMRILTPYFVKQWAGRLINIHPSLLPKYKGLHTHQRALDASDREHGATVHWVTPELDSGEIIAQDRILIPEEATADSLADLIKHVEHRLYPRALEIAANQCRES
jgi:phosphoribosylglycinamide formyltransferase-1